MDYPNVDIEERIASGDEKELGNVEDDSLFVEPKCPINVIDNDAYERLIDQKLSAIFQIYDNENTGEITRNHFAEISSGEIQNEEQMEMMLDAFDPEHTGIIDFNSFCRGIKNLVHSQGGSIDMLIHSLSKSKSRANSIASYNGDQSCRDNLSNYSIHQTRQPSIFEEADDEEELESVSIIESKNSMEKLHYNELDEDEKRYSNKLNPNLLRNNDNCYLMDVADGEKTTVDIRNNYKQHMHKRSIGNPVQMKHIMEPNTTRATSQSPLRYNRSMVGHQSQSPYKYNIGGQASSIASGGTESGYGDGDYFVLDGSMSRKIETMEENLQKLLQEKEDDSDRVDQLHYENNLLKKKLLSLEDRLSETAKETEDCLTKEKMKFDTIVTLQEKQNYEDQIKLSGRLDQVERECNLLLKEKEELLSNVNAVSKQMEETEKQANTRDDVINNLEQNNKNLQQKLLAQRAQSELEKVNSLQMLDKLYQEMQEMKIAHKESWMRSKSNARTDSTTDADERVQQLEAEVYYLKSETRHLKETNENLSAQLMVRSMEEGKLLLQVGNNEVMSLAAEFEQLSKDELMEKLRESQALNMRYREYIDRMLLRILETCPSLLEIKGLGNDLPPIPTAESVRSSMRAKPKVEQTKSSLAKRLSFSSIKSTLAAGMLPPSVNTPSISESIVSESIEEVQDETLY
ncbi:hypothetical protein SNEBB_005604 [Seison nebaliae]|nr:hypothetical protein SNEBB_005604 [Seison nebaliae]